MDKPLISILIPVYNREKLVGETIESAINQTYKNIEIIIVDNCSTDNTWQVLEHYAALDNRIRLFKNKENIGPVRNWKRCIDEAKGEYSKILFSDDLISENFVEDTLKCFKKDIAFVLTPFKVFGQDKDFKSGSYENINEITTEEYLNNILLIDKFKFPVSPGAALFRTEDLINSLEVDIPNQLMLDFNTSGAGNDLLLYLNTAIKYRSIKIASTSTSFFRSHNDSFTIANRLNVYYEYARLYFIQKHKTNLLAKFKAITWFRVKRKITNNSVYNLIKARMDWLFLIKQVIMRILHQKKR